MQEVRKMQEKILISDYFILACYNCNYDSLVVLNREMNRKKYGVTNSMIFSIRENDSFDVIRENIINHKVPIPDYITQVTAFLFPLYNRETQRPFLLRTD